jgi:hypothetical protein
LLPTVSVVEYLSLPVLVCLVAMCLLSVAVDLKVSVALCPLLVVRVAWVEAPCLSQAAPACQVAMFLCLLVLPLTLQWADPLSSLDLRLLSRVWRVHLCRHLLVLSRCSLVILHLVHLALFLFPAEILRLEAAAALTFRLAVAWEAYLFRLVLVLLAVM